MKARALLMALVVAAPVLAGCFDVGNPFGADDHQEDGPLKAAFSFDPEEPKPDQEVRFFDESTGPVQSRHWDFGDGTSLSIEDPTHTYVRADVYEVRLTVRDAAGNESVAERFVPVGVQVGPGGPVQVDFDASVKGLTVLFEPRIAPPDTVVSQYFWDFGDGSVSRDITPVHTYDRADAFEVVLRASANGTVYQAIKTVEVGSLAAFGPLSDRSFAVIAIVDSGVNPYHEEFRDSSFQTHPSTFIQGYPADAEALQLTFTASQYQKAVAEDEEVWEEAGTGDLYYIPGTRIVGAISVAKRGTYPILDDEPADGGHGTATASIAAGETIGSCPTCLIVVVEGLGDQSVKWAMNQPWIDVISNSWAYCSLRVTCEVDPGVMGPIESPADVDASRRAVEEGKSILFASGNGWLNAFDVPQTTYMHPQTGPDWIVTVGAAHYDSGATVVGTGRPVDVVSYGLNWKGASSTSQTAISGFSGTSSATPLVAGAIGKVIQAGRDALNDTLEGPRGNGVVSEGEAPADAGGAIGDGKLTRAEVERAVYLTALRADGAGPQVPTTLPDSAAYFLYAGYGLVNAESADAAVEVVLGKRAAPTKSLEDQWAAVDSQIRVAVWGSWNDGGGLEAAPNVPDDLVVDDVDEWDEVVGLFADAYPPSASG